MATTQTPPVTNGQNGNITVPIQSTGGYTQAQVSDLAKANPGQVVQGAQTGSTVGGQGLPPVATYAQSYTAPAVSPDAQKFLDQQKQYEANTQQAILNQQNANKVATASGTTSYFDSASGTWKSGSSPQTQAVQQQVATQSSGTAGTGATTSTTDANYANDPRMKILDQQAEYIKNSLNNQQQALNAQFDQKIRAAAAQQKSESGQSSMTLARMGAMGTTASGVSYMQSLDAQHASTISQMEQERQASLMLAQNAADSQLLDLAAKRLDAVDEIDAKYEKAQANRLAQLSKYQDVQGKSYDALAEAGKTLEDFPEGFFAHQDEVLNSYGIQVPAGTSEALFVASQKANEAAKAETIADQTDKATAVAKDIQSIMSNMMPGQAVPIGSGTYFNTSGSAIIEADAKGIARMSITKADGTQEIKNLGPVGKASDLTREMHNGKEMLFNKTTQTYTDISGEPSLRDTMIKFFPSGKKPPIGNGQCGNSWNLVTGGKAGRVGDSLESKVALTDPSLNIYQLVPGDSFVMSTNKPYGHIGFINHIDRLDDGRLQYTLSESNWDGQGTWTNERKMFSDDPRLKGYISTHDKLPAEMMAETIGGEGVPMQTDVPDDSSNGFTIPNNPLTAFSGTMKEFDTAKKAEEQAVLAAKSLVSKDLKITEVPAGVRGRALEIAKANGYNQEEGEASENPFAKGLIDGTIKLTEIPMASRREALSLAQKAGYTPKGNKKFQDMSETAKNEFTDLLTMEDQINNIEAFKTTGAEGKEQDTGPLAAGTNAIRGWFNMADQNLLDIDSITQDLKSNIMKQRSGAAVHESEVKRLSKFIPSVSDNDQAFNTKLAHLKETYKTMLENQAKLHGFSDLASFKKEFGIGTQDPGTEETNATPTADLSVTTPDGQTFTFSSQADLENFKKQAGL